MADRVVLSDRVFYYPKGNAPLCAEVFVIRGDRSLWLYDVGNGSAVAEKINALPGEKRAVISHFHPDHMGNWDQIAWEELYLGDYAFSKTQQGTVIEKARSFLDGVSLQITPLPSSHAKGSLLLEAEGFAFLGDGLYPGMKKGKAVLNVTLFLMQIRLLKTLKSHLIVCSHHEKLVRPREEVIAELENLYARRKPNEAYIAWHT